MNEKMFCYQCQETAGCKGCTMVGVCGKQPDVAAMQDLLVYVSKGLSAVTTALRREGQTIPAGINHLITLNLFTTITNANFDRESIEARIRATLEARQEQLARLNRRDGLPEAALWDGSGDWEEKARTVGVLSTRDEDIRSLRELITYGLKGLSAYSKHANVLLQDDPEVDAFPAAGAGCDAGRQPDRAGPGEPDAGNRQVRRGGHGAAGQGQHRGLRQPRDHPCVAGRARQSGHPCVGA